MGDHINRRRKDEGRKMKEEGRREKGEGKGRGNWEVGRPAQRPKRKVKGLSKRQTHRIR